MDEQLKVRVVVDKSDFNKGITEVKKELNSTADSTKQGVSGVSQEVKSVAGSIKQSIASAIGVAIPTIGRIRNEIKSLKKELKIPPKGSYEGYAREAERTYSKMYKKYKSQGFDDETAKHKAGWSPEFDEVMGRWNDFNTEMEELERRTSLAHRNLVELRKTVYDGATSWLQPMKRGLSSIFSTLGKGLKETAQFKGLSV